jgi:hypothetical protein
MGFPTSFTIVLMLTFSTLATVGGNITVGEKTYVPGNNPSSPHAQPTVTIQFHEEHIVVEGDPDTPLTVNSTGTVTADSVGPGSNVQSIEVDLIISSMLGARYFIDPESMDFPPGGGSEDFSWSIYYPPISENNNDTVAIQGIARTLPGGVSYRIPEVYATVEFHVSDPAEGDDDDDESGGDGGDGTDDALGSFSQDNPLLWVLVATIAAAVAISVVLRLRRREE